MHPYIKPLVKQFSNAANPLNAAPMKAYMKNNFEFFGIKSTERRLLSKTFLEQCGLPDIKDMNTIALSLFNQPQRELHYFAIELLLKMKKHWTVDTIEILEQLLLKNSWWDSVDTIATHCIAFYSQQFPREAKKKIAQWNKSSNLWLNRTSIIYQCNMKSKTNVAVLFSNIEKHLESKEFFIQKAIGWALRQYARTDAQVVKGFCLSTKLKPLSYREAMKHIS